MTRLNDVQRVELAIEICVGFDLGAPLFAALECDLAMLRARDRVALVDAIAMEPDIDDWSELAAHHEQQRKLRTFAIRSSVLEVQRGGEMTNRKNSLEARKR